MDNIKEIVKSEGCTAFYTDIDGVCLHDLPDERQGDIAKFLFDTYMKQQSPATLVDMLLNEMEPDENHYGESCEQCGDSVWRRTFKFNKD